MEVRTSDGKSFNAQRCYENSADNTLNIGLVDATMVEAFPVFSNPLSTQTIFCIDEGNETEFVGYTNMVLITVDDNLNGVYIALRKS